MIDDDDYGAVGGMRIGKGNRSARRKPAPAPLFPPQIPHDLTWDRTRAAARPFPFGVSKSISLLIFMLPKRILWDFAYIIGLDAHL
jgi:hypothetical protein